MSPGTYVENINFLGKAVTLQSTDGPKLTIIDGSNCTSGTNACSVVTFMNQEGPDSVVDGFTITNGSGTEFVPLSFRGGGIFC